MSVHVWISRKRLFDSLVRDTNETWTEFGERLFECALMWFPNLTEERIEIKVCNQLIDSIEDDEMFEAALRTKLWNVKDLLIFIEEYPERKTVSLNTESVKNRYLESSARNSAIGNGKLCIDAKTGNLERRRIDAGKTETEFVSSSSAEYSAETPDVHCENDEVNSPTSITSELKTTNNELERNASDGGSNDKSRNLSREECFSNEDPVEEEQQPFNEGISCLSDRENQKLETVTDSVESKEEASVSASKPYPREIREESTLSNDNNATSKGAENAAIRPEDVFEDMRVVDCETLLKSRAKVVPSLSSKHSASEFSWELIPLSWVNCYRLPKLKRRNMTDRVNKMNVSSAKSDVSAFLLRRKGVKKKQWNRPPRQTAPSSTGLPKQPDPPMRPKCLQLVGGQMCGSFSEASVDEFMCCEDQTWKQFASLVEFTLNDKDYRTLSLDLAVSLMERMSVPFSAPSRFKFVARSVLLLYWEGQAKDILGGFDTLFWLSGKYPTERIALTAQEYLTMEEAQSHTQGRTHSSLWLLESTHFITQDTVEIVCFFLGHNFFEEFFHPAPTKNDSDLDSFYFTWLSM